MKPIHTEATFRNFRIYSETACTYLISQCIVKSWKLRKAPVHFIFIWILSRLMKNLSRREINTWRHSVISRTCLYLQNLMWCVLLRHCHNFPRLLQASHGKLLWNCFRIYLEVKTKAFSILSTRTETILRWMPVLMLYSRAPKKKTRSRSGFVICWKAILWRAFPKHTPKNWRSRS